HEPARVLYSGTDLFPYPSLDALRRFALPNGSPGPWHGFAYDKAARRLYVRLHPSGKYGSTNPADHVIAVSPPTGVNFAGNGINAPHHYNVGILIDGPAHVILDGFTFETPGVAGVFVRGSEVIVRHAWFRGCRTGVSGKSESQDPAKTTNRVRVTACDYSQFPAFDDMVEVIQRRLEAPAADRDTSHIFWWHRKGSGVGIQRTYETGIVNLVGKDWTVDHNYIHDTFEGMSCWAVRWSDGLTVRDNVFERIVDNAVEMEDHARRMRIHDNVILDTFEPLSWQPLGGQPWPGPIYVYRNIIYTRASLIEMWTRAGHTPGWFKAGASGSNWERPNMTGVPMDVVAPPGDGVVVFNNTVIFPGGQFLTRVQPLKRAFENFHFLNNICLTSAFSNGDDFRGSRIRFEHNLWVGSDDARGKIFAGQGGRVLPDAASLRLEDIESHRFAPRQDSPAVGLAGPVAAAQQLTDASSTPRDVGAVSHGQAWRMPAVGPHADGVDGADGTDGMDELAMDGVVRGMTLGQPLPTTAAEEIPGPMLQTRAIRAADTPRQIDLRLEEPLGHAGTVMLWVRLDRVIQAGEAAEPYNRPVLSVPGVAELAIQGAPSQATVRWAWSKSPFDQRNLVTHVPGLPGPAWMHLAFVWDTDTGISQGYLNGTPLRLPGTRIPPWTPPHAESLILHLSELGISSVQAISRALTADEICARVPVFYLDNLATVLGQRDLGELRAPAGELIYDNPLSSPSDLAGWRMEGPGQVTFEQGAMILRSTRPDGPNGNFVYWCDRDFPDHIRVEWEVQPVEDQGLCIIFFSAKGRHGEDIFDPSLAPRNGVFSQYHSGDINCYHISYYANAPDAPGRITINMRKNHGLYLVTNGPAGIIPGSRAWHTVTLVKDGPRIQMGIDGKRVIDFFDDGQTYGPILGGGKIGLRQMQWTRMKYRNFRVYALPEP
ncbi:MAG TPA: DUF1961 family protein, partial [Phycisphaeraceae bacterium]